MVLEIVKGLCDCLLLLRTEFIGNCTDGFQHTAILTEIIEHAFRIAAGDLEPFCPCLTGNALLLQIGMQGGDNDFYLHHAYDGSRLSSGSVFLDFRCESRFMKNLNVLYGHHMNNGSMFAGVCNFKDYGYFQAHKYGWLITADDVYRIDFFSAAVTDCDDEIYSGFENTADRLSHIYDISAIYEPTEISEQDRLVLLSTCSYECENARTVLTGKLVRMGDDI